MNFIEVYFNGVLKHSIKFSSNTLTIGRAPSNQLVIDNMGVSGHHAIISQSNNQYFIEDLNSTNGSFLNNEKITEKRQISASDSITIGKHTLRFAEWSHHTEQQESSYAQIPDEATMLVAKAPNSKPKNNEIVQDNFYLMVTGDSNKVGKLLLDKNNIGIGKAKDNSIRIKGWFTPSQIAEIQRIGQSYYLIPFKRKMVSLNNRTIEDSIKLSPDDRIKIKNITIRFMKD